MKNNFWDNKKIAVTGSSGFIGQEIVNFLSNKNVEIISISRREGIDIFDINELEKKTKGVDVLISCAAIDGNGDFKKRHSSTILDSNIRIASNVLNVSVKNNIKKIVLFSSAEVYPINIKSPFSEKDDYVNNPEHTENGYVLSKRITEILANQFANEYGLQILLPRPTNVYGPNDQNKRVISTLIENISKNLDINIWGNGLQKRSFIYVEDLVSILASLIEMGVTGSVNISSDEDISILRLSKLIARFMNKKPNIVFDKEKGNQVDRVLDIGKLKSLMDFGFTKLEDGLLKTINNYLEFN